MSRANAAGCIVIASGFLFIGFLSARFGHGVGLAALVAGVLVIFAIDTLSRRREHRAGSADPSSDAEVGRPP